MTWTTTTQQDLHWRVAQFMETYGSEHISVAQLNRSVEACYKTGQYRVNGEYFLTWAFFDEQQEKRFLSGDTGVMTARNVTWSEGKKLWVLNAWMGNKILNAINELSPLSHGSKSFRMLVSSYLGTKVRVIPLRVI